MTRGSPIRARPGAAILWLPLALAQGACAAEAGEPAGVDRQLLQLEQRALSQEQETAFRRYRNNLPAETASSPAAMPDPELIRRRSEQEYLFQRQAQEQMTLERQRPPYRPPYRPPGTVDPKPQFQQQQFDQQWRQLQLQQDMRQRALRPLPTLP